MQGLAKKEKSYKVAAQTFYNLHYNHEAWKYTVITRNAWKSFVSLRFDLEIACQGIE